MIGKENELAKFYTPTSTPNGQGGFTTTYAEIAYNPVWVAVNRQSNPSKSLDFNESMRMFESVAISFRVNNKWTPSKKMILKIRDRWYAISAISLAGFKDEYYNLVVEEIDHAQ